MDQLEDYAIKKVAKGGTLIFAGILISSVAFLLYRVIAARYLGPVDYGLLTLGITILNIGSLIGLFGIHNSVGKFINHYLARKQYGKAKGTIITSFIITFIVSMAVLFLLYYSSDFIADEIFHIKGLGSVIAIFSIGIPFSVFSQLLKFYFFAFKKSEYVIISESLFEKILNLSLLIMIVFVTASLHILSWAYVITLVISSIIAALLLKLKILNAIKGKISGFNFKQLISFSFPLMVTGILGVALAWTDTFFIAFFGSDADVGIYNTAYVIASALIIFWLSIGDIFYPIISELYSKKSKKAIKVTFETASRWVFIPILPIFAFVLVFPARTLSLVFGQAYLGAAMPLAILIIGYFLTSFFGLAEQGLRTFKKTGFLGIATTLALAGNAFLNIVLIPLYGITGAAMATTITLFIVNTVKFFFFKSILNFSHNIVLYFKYIFSCAISLGLVLFTIKFFGLLSTLNFIIAIIVYFFLYYFLIIAFKSFSEEDIEVLEGIERKMKVNFGFVKRFIK